MRKDEINVQGNLLKYSSLKSLINAGFQSQYVIIPNPDFNDKNNCNYRFYNN